MGIDPLHRPWRGTADGERDRRTRGRAGLHAGTRLVSAGRRDATAGPGAVGAVAVLWSTTAVAHGARDRGNIAAPGATCPRPCACGPRPLCPRVDVVLPWCVAG